jgi:hypothetical protein
LTLNSVETTELDGALGTLPAGTLALAMLAIADGGPVATPATFAQSSDVVTNFVGGPLVQGAGYAIDAYKRPVICVRVAKATDGTCSAVTFTGSGTSVVTVDAVNNKPNDDYEFRFKVINGGTIGVTGITFQWSADDGRNWQPVTALGIANTFTLPGVGAVEIDFAAGTLVAGDQWTFRGNAPQTDAAGLTAGLTALRQSAIQWDMCLIDGVIDATLFDAIEVAFGSMPEKMWIGSARAPNLAESEATYLTALNTIFSSKATVKGQLCAGAAEISSPIDGRKYRRQIGMAVGPRQAFVDSEIDTAEIDLGALPGVSIRDVNGNPKHHDELINPGLDDARFTVLRSWEGSGGAYINNPRIFCPAGSDFEFVQHRRVMNEAKRALRLYFQRRLSKPILVDKNTGYILKSEAEEIQSGANAILRAVLRAKPKVSFCSVTVSRTDNLLSTKTLTVFAEIVPLAYPKKIALSVGFKNPALTTVAV